MKKFLTTTLFILSLGFTNPFQAQATFPEKNVVFWDLGQSDEQKDKELVKAYDLAKQKNYKQALEAIEQKIQVSANSTTLYVMKGLILNEMREYIPSVRALNKAQTIEARHPGIHYGFCEVYRNLGMSDLSLRGCRIAEEIHRLSPEVHYEYAQTLIAVGEMTLANKSLSTAAQLDPSNALYHYQKGMNFYYLNQYDNAEQSFQKAISIDAVDVDSAYQLAYIFAARQKSNLAKKQIKKVLQIKKEHPKIESAKLLLEYVEKNALDKLPLEIIPHEYHIGKSKSYYKSKDYGLALIEIETAAKLKPDDTQIKEILIGLTGFLLRINKAEKVIKKMISIVGETDIIAAKGYQELGDI
ncbi:uncharacterized protein METZ01_LOCUS156127, partial [marine metagenome]